MACFLAAAAAAVLNTTPLECGGGTEERIFQVQTAAVDLPAHC